MPGLIALSQSVVDHSSMVEECRLLRPELECLLDRRRCLARAIGLVQRPGKRVVAEDVLSLIQVVLRQAQRLVELTVVIAVESGEEPSMCGVGLPGFFGA